MAIHFQNLQKRYFWLKSGPEGRIRKPGGICPRLLHSIIIFPVPNGFRNFSTEPNEAHPDVSKQTTKPTARPTDVFPVLNNERCNPKDKAKHKGHSEESNEKNNFVNSHNKSIPFFLWRWAMLAHLFSNYIVTVRTVETGHKARAKSFWRGKHKILADKIYGVAVKIDRFPPSCNAYDFIHNFCTSFPLG